MLQLLLFEISYCFNQQFNHLNIYPTVNEMFILPLDILFEKSNLLRVYNLSNPQNDQVKIKNALDLKYNTSGAEIRTIDSNETHFVALLKHTKQIDIFDINLQFHTIIDYFDQFCNNAIFFINYIVVDCYDLKLLKLSIVEQSSLKEVYRSISENTTNTKMIACSSKDQQYLLYLQRFVGQNNYSAILTKYILDGTTLREIFNFSGTWIDVTCSSTENIYLINQQNNLIQYALQGNNLVKGYEIKFVNQLFAISSFNFQKIDSQSDFLVIILQGQYPIRIYKAQSNYFYFMSCYSFDLTNFNLTQINKIQIYLNSEFLIVKNFSNILLAQNWLTVEKLDDSLNYQIIENLTENVIYFNKFNYLYHFGLNTIKVFIVQEPALIINISNETKGEIRLGGIQNKQFIYIDYVKISYIVLNNTNSSALPEFETSKIIPVVTFSQSWIYFITYYSGGLLYLDNKNNNKSQANCNQTNITFEKLHDIYTNDCQFSKIITFKTNYTKFYFLIASKYNTLKFYIGNSHKYEQIYEAQIISSIINANSIQASITYPSTINVGILQTTQIVVFKFNFSSNFTEYFQESFTNTYLSEIQQFLLTFNSIVVLYYERKIITIDTLQPLSNPLNWQNITENFFENISQFNPIGLASNQIQQSSIIFINNQDSILILGIGYEIQLYPIIKCSVKIKQFTVLNNYLILLFEQNNINKLQQWNIKSLYTPFLMREFDVDIQKNWQLTSDNQFLFILSNQNYMQVYQPILSQHKQLYTQFPFYDDYISSTPSIQANDFAVLSFKSGIYNLRAAVTYEIICNPENVSQYFYTFYYNYTINSLLGNENQAPNVSYISQINLINDSTNINITNFKIKINGSHVKILLNSLNLTQNNSILEISANDKTNNKQGSKTNSCNVINYFQTPKPISNTLKQYNIVFNIKNNFYLQNNTEIAFYNFTTNSTHQTADYSNISCSQCLCTAVYNNLITSICINNQSQYQLISFYFINILNIQFLVVSNISINFAPRFIYQYQNLTFIILNYTNYSEINLNIFNIPYYSLNYQQNDSQPLNQIQFLCKPIDIEVVDFFKIPNEQPTNILIFTLCENLVNYQFGNYSDNSFEKPKQLVFLKYIQIKMTFVKISILKHYQNQIEALLSTTQSGSYIITLNVYLDNQEKQLLLTSMVSVITPYGKFILSSFVFFSQGINYFKQDLLSNQSQLILLTQFDKDKQYVFTLHQFYPNSTIDIPLAVKGGLNQTISSPLSIISMAAYLNSSSQQNQVILISNQSTDDGNYFSLEIQQFNITNQPEIQCTLKPKMLSFKNYEKMEFTAKNSFHKANFTITFDFVEEAYIVWSFVLVIIALLGSFILLMYLSLDDDKENDSKNNDEL